MRRWIAKTKAGLLTRKKYVTLLLAELIEDTTFWLTLQSMSDEERDVEFAKLTPAEKYWYQYLFPTWFNEKDPKLNTWKKNLMADKFEASDASKISDICKHIKSLGGATLKPYLYSRSISIIIQTIRQAQHDMEAEIKIGECIFRSSDNFSEKCYYVLNVDERGDYVRQL